MVWGKNLGSEHSQDSHLLKDTRAIDIEEKTKVFHIQISFSQNTVSLSSINYCLDFY